MPRFPFFSLLVPVLFPASALIAMERDDAHLVDRVIPAYGAANPQPYYVVSSVDGLYYEINALTARIEGQIMAGQSSKRPVAQIQELTQRLRQAEAGLSLPNYRERWQIDAAYANLQRAVDQMNLSGQLSAAEFTQLHLNGETLAAELPKPVKKSDLPKKTKPTSPAKPAKIVKPVEPPVEPPAAEPEKNIDETTAEPAAAEPAAAEPEMKADE